MRAGEAGAWRAAWATPQAVAWERLGCERVVARYVRAAVLAEAVPQAALMAQVTALEDRLGLTPKAMRLLLWEIAVDEVGDRREASEGVRRRIKAV